jgi:hypothetical protein
VAIIKYKSSIENPITISEIATEFQKITGMNMYPRKVRRYLAHIISLTTTDAPDEDEEEIPQYELPEFKENQLNAIISAIGGSIKRTSTNPQTKAKNTKKGYYFEPFINDSEFELIKGAMISNRYVQSENKKYLIKLLEFLHPDTTKVISENKPKKAKGFQNFPAYNNAVMYESMPKCPAPKARSRFYSDAVLFIKHINTIYDAIHNNYKLTLTYGVFTESQNRINLVPDGRAKRIINPYAVLWSNGKNYLIATDSNEVSDKNGEDEPVNIYHFRIDRIYELEVPQIPDPSKIGQTKKRSINVARDVCPDYLMDFFKDDTLTDFDEERYRSTHPLMSFSDSTKDNEEILINCSKRCLSVLVDNFGQNSEFINGETIKTERKNDFALPFPKDKGYTIKIRDADYNSIKRLCLNMQDDMYVLTPESLRNEIISELEKKVSIYKQI